MSGVKRILQPQNESPEKRPAVCNSNEKENFDFNKLCVICGKEKGKDKRRSMVEETTSNGWNKVKEAAQRRGEDCVLERVREMEDAKTKGKYHKSCYSSYTSNKFLDAAETDLLPCLFSTRERPHILSARAVISKLQTELQAGKFFLLKQVATIFKTEMCQFSENYTETHTVRTNRVKDWILMASEPGTVEFHSLGAGRPDILCRSGLSLGEVLNQCISLINEDSAVNDFGANDEDPPQLEPDLACLFKAARILRERIDLIPTTKVYPQPEHCLLENSRQLVPKELFNFVRWIVHNEMEPEDSELTDEDTLKKITAICETLIYSSRRKKRNQVIPPFHLGLAIQLMEGADSELISQLHSHGLCVSYDELRRFETAAATEQLRNCPDEYVPEPIVHCNESGMLVQEGDDNADILVETIDGKDTYHCMVRVLFQMQSTDQMKNSAPIERQQSRSLNVNKNEMPQFKVHSFPKPPAKPEPAQFPGASSLVHELQMKAGHLYNKDALWVVLRSLSRGSIIFAEKKPASQNVPFWVGFNTRTGIPNKLFTVCSYVPSIDKRPADFSTVYTTLRRGKAMALKCGQAFHIHTFDQQLYAIAQHVKMSLPEEFSDDTVIRLGNFHDQCTLIACIGTMFGDAGLKDMLSDSGIYASGTVDQMLKGKQYHRAVRGLTICFEVLFSLLLENFQAWLFENNREILDTFMEKLTPAYESYASEKWTDRNMESLQEFLDSSFLPLLDDFVGLGRENIPTFRFWTDCLYALHLLLTSIRAEREGNWDLHLATQAAMLPLFFACDRTNYARYATLYVLEMSTKLPKDVQEAFQQGHHSVKLSSGAFRGIPTDMGVEMTVVRDTKSDSGICGFTRKESTVLRWTVTKHIRARYRRAMRERNANCNSNNNKDPNSHEQERMALFTRDEEDVKKMLQYVRTFMKDPFSASGDTENLLHIGNGLTATPEIRDSLLNAFELGNNRLHTFIQKRLETSVTQRSPRFYDTLPKSNLKTFALLQKPTVIRIHGKTVAKVISSEVVFTRALQIKQYRFDYINFDEILSRPMTSVPPALFKYDGSRRFTNKAALLHILEDDLKTQQLPFSTEHRRPSVTDGEYTVSFVDSMADLQKLNPKSMKTFRDVGAWFLGKVLERLNFCNEVHVIFDRYDRDDITPKTIERQRRYGLGNYIYEIEEDRPIPNWEKVMSSDENKAALTNFLSVYIERNASLQIPDKKLIVLAGGYTVRETCKIVSQSCVVDSVNLSCNHTEADTRIVFHAVWMASAVKEPCVFFVESPDTDVFILMIAHYHKLKEGTKVWFETGTASKGTDRHRFIPVHQIVAQQEKKTPSLCTALPAIHALTGCDTVSSLKYMGKKLAMQAAREMTTGELYHLSTLGNNTVNCQLVATKFICRIYDLKGKYKHLHHDVNKLRSRLALMRTLVDRLPPSGPALELHLLRSQWQHHIWLNAHHQTILVKDPLECGWCIENEHILPVLFNGPTSIELIQKFVCSCAQKNRPCAKEHCPCNELGIACCEICLCNDSCVNSKSTDTPR